MVVTDYNEKFLDKRGTDHLIEELKAYIDGISTGDIDLSDYVTKSELQAKLDALDINIDLSSYATKEELTEAINSIDLSAYALKTEIPSLDGYAKITDIPRVPTKVSELENDSGYLTEHQDLSSYALKEEIPSLEGYATTEYVDNAIASVPTGGTVDLSDYYTKEEVYNKEETDALIPTVTDGIDGVSPTVSVTETTNGHTVAITDVNGIKSFDVTNGTNGVSPTVTVTKEGKIATIVCTDVNGTTTATISDGADGSGGGSSSGGGASDVYSTEETAIGTWIDGSTIYRKVIEYGKLNTLSASGEHGQAIVNFKEPFGIILRMTALLANSSGSVHYCIDGSSDKVILVPSTSTSTYVKQAEDYKAWLISTNRTSVTLWYGREFCGNNCTFIIEYTKN